MCQIPIKFRKRGINVDKINRLSHEAEMAELRRNQFFKKSRDQE